MNSSPLPSAILQQLSPERAAGIQQVDKISVSSGNTSSLVLNANLWAVALGSKLSARLPFGHSVCNRSRSRIKLIFWDGPGLWCCGKRLAKGRFKWPMECDGSVRIRRSSCILRIRGVAVATASRPDLEDTGGQTCLALERNTSIMRCQTLTYWTGGCLVTLERQRVPRGNGSRSSIRSGSF